MKNKRNGTVTIQSAERALDILELLSQTTEALSAIEISKELNINRTTVYGLLNTLMKKDYIRKESSSGKYVVTEKMYALSYAHPYRLPVVRIASPYIIELSKRYSITVHLGILSVKNEVLLVKAQFPPDLEGVRSGNSFPLYATGSGKVMLAYLSSKKRESVMNEIELYPYTKATITDKDVLLKELDLIRHRGYGTDKGEYLENTYCIAFPIFNSQKEITATLSLSGTREKIENHFDDIVPDGMQCSKYCSMELGWNPGE